MIFSDDLRTGDFDQLVTDFKVSDSLDSVAQNYGDSGKVFNSYSNRNSYVEYIFKTKLHTNLKIDLVT